MARTYYFTNSGEPFSPNAETGDDAVSKGNAIKVDNVPDGIEAWRLSIDPSNSALTVFGGADADEAAALQAKVDADQADALAMKDIANDLVKAQLAADKKLKDAGLA